MTTTNLGVTQGNCLLHLEANAGAVVLVPCIDPRPTAYYYLLTYYLKHL